MGIEIVVRGKSSKKHALLYSPLFRETIIVPNSPSIAEDLIRGDSFKKVRIEFKVIKDSMVYDAPISAAALCTSGDLRTTSSHLSNSSMVIWG
jgi:hypothetical protein